MRLILGWLTLLVLVSCGVGCRVGENAPGDPGLVDISVTAGGGLRLNEFTLTIPKGWSYREMEDGGGWVMAKVIPGVPLGLEPTIVARMMAYPSQETLESVLEERQSVFTGSGDEVATAKVARLPATGFSSDAAYLTYRGEWDGHRYQARWVLIPGSKPGHFLLLDCTSFQRGSWKELTHGLDAVLRSLDRAETVPRN